MATPPSDKQGWLRLLKGTSIPSFNASIQTLSNAEEYAKTHSSELARTILKDPNLTTWVLKLANSAHFNRFGQSVKTISRSIMVLGHKSIKEVCASCLLMEQFLKQGASEKLQLLLARAFHAAIQAKEIALMQGQKSTEEIFIAALLLNLGEISVYSAVTPTSDMAKQLSKGYPLKSGSERDIIGCYFNDLTLGLCQAWNIAPMVTEVLGGKYAENSPVRSILLGNSFASSCETEGFDSSLKKHIKSLARYTAKSTEEVSEKILKATEETQKSLLQFGIKLDIKFATSQKSVSQIKPVEIKIDKILQLDVIQELSVMVQEKFEIDEILQSITEGIHRGANFQVSLVALLSPDNKRIVVKHAIEKKDDKNTSKIKSSLKEDFDFNCDLDIPELKQKVMNNRKVVLQTSLRAQSATLKQVLKRTGSQNAIWGPLIVENKIAGCFYASNGADGPLVTSKQFEAFELFVYQACLLLHKLN